MLNIYVDWSAAELIAERKRLSKEAQKMVTSVSAGDTSVSKQQTQQGIRTTIAQINRALLKIAVRENTDPSDYGVGDEDAFTTDRTRPNFWCSTSNLV